MIDLERALAGTVALAQQGNVAAVKQVTNAMRVEAEATHDRELARWLLDAADKLDMMAAAHSRPLM